MARTLVISGLHSSSFAYSSSSVTFSPKQQLPFHHYSHVSNHSESQRPSCAVLRCDASRSRSSMRGPQSGAFSKHGYGVIHRHHRLSHRCIQASQASNQSIDPNQEDGYEREARRWEREEQRWLREEQRWLREEARWNAHRDSLLSQISDLQLRIQCLETELQALRLRVSPDSNFVIDAQILTQAASLLQQLQQQQQVLPNSNANTLGIPGQTSPGLVLEDSKPQSDSDVDKPKPTSAPVPSVSESKGASKAVVQQKENQPLKGKTNVTLRMGSEGDEVRALQEALLSLGFYSGEEDMEYSSFSSGTERAVKTWQASIHVKEDGIVTAELLERLYASPHIEDSGSSGDPNGAPSASVPEVKEVQQDAEFSTHRVFLLGENRWEEPSRLKTGNGKFPGADTTQVSATKCPTCRGEGRLLCMECDGTGEPNIEPQFMEWVEEGTKCPYCEGRGYSVCDACEGKAVA